MNKKHKKTLAAIMSDPAPKTLPFKDVESLLRGIGCKVKEHEGSRVGFVKDGIPWTTHRPHPGKEIPGYQIKQVRGFLKDLGITL